MRAVKDPVEQMAAARADKTLWRRQLRQNEKGVCKGDLDTVMSALEFAPDLKDIAALDEFSGRLFRVKPTPWNSAAGPSLWTDTDDVQLQRWLQQQGIPVAHVTTVVSAVRTTARRFHVLRDYLDGLKWDKKKRVERWLPTYLGTEDNAYTRAVGMKWLVSAVARAMQPGCQADHVLALEGPQGALKSSAIKTLGGEWTKEDLAAIGTKDALVDLQSAWLVEMSELAAMGRSEVEQIKSFITRRVDKFRPPYGTHSIERPRSCVFVATTNEDRWLKDTSGNRRFWPVKVGRVDLKTLARDRDQLWAEVVQLYRNGTAWHITETDVLRFAEAEQSKRIEDDPWTTALRTSELGKQLFGPKPNPVTTKHLLAALNVGTERMTGGHAKRLGGVMRRWGWSSHVDQSGSGREVWWFPKSWSADDVASWFAKEGAKSRGK